MTEKRNEYDADLEEIRKKKMKSLLEKKKQETQGALEWPHGTIEVTDQNFDEIIKKYPVVVVDCWAPWCGPCQMVGPVIEALANDYRGKIVFGKLNVDVNQRIAGKYGIMSIPTMLIFKNGSLADQQTGALPREMLEPIVKRFL
ncbi:MAG: thioredoxin [Thermoplasmata archaeon]|nr:thioredoxin [Thermoplasmata archaeon]